VRGAPQPEERLHRLGPQQRVHRAPIVDLSGSEAGSPACANRPRPTARRKDGAGAGRCNRGERHRRGSVRLWMGGMGGMEEGRDRGRAGWAGVVGGHHVAP
jgi:hypothetical protein